MAKYAAQIALVDAVQTIRAKMRQDMPIKIPLVGLSVPRGFPRKGQIAPCTKSLTKTPASVLLSEETRHFHPSRHSGKKVYRLAS